MALLAGPVCADVLTPDNANFYYSSYAHITVNSSMARFDRIISNSHKSDNPGARVRFNTNATSATATVNYNSLESQIVCSTGTILVDGVQTGTFTVGSPRGTVSFSVLSQGSAVYHTVELVMPYWDSVDFTGLTVNSGASFQAPPAKPSVRWVAYGDSITQGGYASVNPFVEQIARANSWESVNMGFGGDSIQPGDGVTLGTLGATVITEMMGHNNASAGTSSTDFTASMAAWVSNIRSQQPNVPIYLISPIYTSNSYLTLLASYGPALQSLVTNSGDPNLHYIDGMTLGINSSNVATYLQDGVHPNDAGTALIASNLAGLISTSFVATPGSSVQAAYSNSATNLAYTPSADGVVSNDLVLNGSSSFVNCTPSAAPWGSFTVAGLTDGAVSTSDISKSTFWNGDNGWPMTLTFSLNTNVSSGGCANGYNISKIETIGGWTGAFVDQRYTVWVKKVGSSSYVQLGGNFVDPTVTGSTTSTRTVITDSSGTLATSVQYVQLRYSAPVNGYAGSLVIQEVAICGTSNTTLQATYSNSSTSIAYSPRTDGVLANDLVLNGQPSSAGSTSSITPSGGFALSGLTDGNTSSSDNTKCTYFSTGWPVTLTFNLNTNPATGGCATGYNISKIETIAGWTTGFVDQRYTVWVQKVGSASYVQVGGNFLDPTVTGSTNSTKTVITDSTGTIAAGIQSVQLVYSTPQQTSGQVVIQEVAICGTPVSNPVLQATYYNSTTAGAYASDISSTDLINNGQATYASGSMDTTPTNGTFGGLNDGLGTQSLGQISETMFKNGSWPTTLIFNLNVTSNTGGYDISKIQTIAGWTSNFVDQRYTVWVKTVANPTYVQVGGNFLDPTVASGTLSTKTVITESSGVIASGVTSIEFVYSAPVNGSANSLVIQEIDVFGTPTVNYNAWIASYPSLTGSNALSTAVNSNGLTNLQQYAFGTDPTVSAPSSIDYHGSANPAVLDTHGPPVALNLSGGSNGVNYNAVFCRRTNYSAVGLGYQVQFSGDLTNWVNSAATPSVLATDGTIDAVSVPYPLFIRVNGAVVKPTFFRVVVSSP